MDKLFQPHDVIDGVNALDALSKGYSVFWRCTCWDDNASWRDLNGESSLTIVEILSGKLKFVTGAELDVIFKIAPKQNEFTITIPECFSPKEGDQFYYLNIYANEGYSFAFYNPSCKSQIPLLKLGVWENEEDVKTVVSVLKQVLTFRSGT